MVPVNHPVRIVNTIIDQIDIADLERSYKGDGTSSYHPRMLLKVTIYAFRGKPLKGKFKNIFNQVVLLLVDQGVLSLKELFVDGTKVEANANRFTFVWGKSIKNSKERIKETAARTMVLYGRGL
ncbi:transposase [Mesonia aquimarina]